MMKALTSKQRQYLKGLAHPLSPIVRVGKGGLTEAVVAETKKSLASHELIKVRVDIDDTSERRTTSEKLAEASDSQLAAAIGKVAVLYRERDEDPDIELP
ncbi:MAG: ribosome assembly RNA-binding protein YhbY [Acidobacteriota bacterium]